MGHHRERIDAIGGVVALIYAMQRAAPEAERALWADGRRQANCLGDDPPSWIRRIMFPRRSQLRACEERVRLRLVTWLILLRPLVREAHMWSPSQPTECVDAGLRAVVQIEQPSDSQAAARLLACLAEPLRHYRAGYDAAGRRDHHESGFGGPFDGFVLRLAGLASRRCSGNFYLSTLFGVWIAEHLGFWDGFVNGALVREIDSGGFDACRDGTEKHAKLLDLFDAAAEEIVRQRGLPARRG